jgi:hypothetical protein
VFLSPGGNYTTEIHKRVSVSNHGRPLIGAGSHSCCLETVKPDFAQSRVRNASPFRAIYAMVLHVSSYPWNLPLPRTPATATTSDRS